MYGGVINKYTALLHHFLDVAQAQRVGHVPAHAGQHHFKSVVQPLESIAQCAVDQTFAEIKHGPDCRLCLMQHNLFQPLGIGVLLKGLEQLVDFD